MFNKKTKDPKEAPAKEAPKDAKETKDKKDKKEKKDDKKKGNSSASASEEEPVQTKPTEQPKQVAPTSPSMATTEPKLDQSADAKREEERKAEEKRKAEQKKKDEEDKTKSQPREHDKKEEKKKKDESSKEKKKHSTTPAPSENQGTIEAEIQALEAVKFDVGESLASYKEHYNLLPKEVFVSFDKLQNFARDLNTQIPVPEFVVIGKKGHGKSTVVNLSLVSKSIQLEQVESQNDHSMSI